MTQHDDAIPPGWDYNPASWPQRLPIVGLALVGVGVAGYLGLYQLEVFPTVWEPFFGNDSRKILNSSVSDFLPIPDGVLGALSYLLDAVAGVIGGVKRWKTMPWIVIIFGMLVGPLGVVSIMLVVLQPVLFDAWCTLCLTSAFISVLMIGPALDEMLASLQYMQRVKRSGASFWKAFWGTKEVVSIN
ncbi:Vitamin K epoxide reductase family protein [Catalinimonas alkaloidigena]|uniref:Vitamin K epoxide reductase family protein n=1 Tax=Catalinimonas alkaloidigena TaxID=1075417 RepID=A0A1G8XNA6_9BACT|nr:vitamin K epoxide reductase family protein [Catalinimonas alkaloidigena]SDJ92061.1 Vitamin K epoxide reductase family protein [Catalinimonas alkaloidigena]